jgi:tetratricopeptide (TPR) repeat protein
MRRRPSIVWCGLVLWLLSAQAGCGWLSLRTGRGPASAEQASRARQVTERALAAVDRGDYASARVDLLQLAAETPDSSEVQQRLGTVFQLEGRLVEAETSFRAALKRDPDYVEALIGLGQVEAQNGDLASALKRFETAIEIDPHRSKAHACLGQLLESTNKPDLALAEYFRALEFDPNNPALGLRIAAIHLTQNEPDQALSRLDQVIELASENAEARALRGRAHLALQHFPLAIDDFRAAISRLAARADNYYYLALALEADHKPAAALRAAEEALRLAPNFVDARGLSQRLALAVEPPVRPRPPRSTGDQGPPVEPAR